MKRSYVFRLYPNREQTRALNGQMAGACDLYNAALQARRDAWRRAKVSISFFDQCRELTGMRAEGLVDVTNCQVAQQVLRRVDRTLQSFFRRVKEGKRPGYPRFKAKSRYNSIVFPTYGTGAKFCASNKLYVHGVGKMRINQHRQVMGDIKTVTIKRAAGRFYAILSCLLPDPVALPQSPLDVGLDVGIIDFATPSDDSPPLVNGRFYRRGQRALRIASRSVSRKKTGSKGREKAVQTLQRAHRRIKNQRHDMQHKASYSLVAKYGMIAVEDLDLEALGKSMLAKHIRDCAWGSFLHKLTYKAESAGRTLVKVNPHGTSQRCSQCGQKQPKPLSQRWHTCSCGLSIGRDVNAARNILGLGRSLVASTWGTGPSVAAEAAI